MQRLDLQTPDFVAANAEKLAALFPNCVTESRNPQIEIHEDTPLDH